MFYVASVDIGRVNFAFTVGKLDALSLGTFARDLKCALAIANTSNASFPPQTETTIPSVIPALAPALPPSVAVAPFHTARASKVVEKVFSSISVVSFNVISLVDIASEL